MAMEALRIAAKESKIMKFILGGFIFLAVGGLVFTDVGGYFTGGARGTTLAHVGETKLDIRQFDRELQPFLQQIGMTAQEAYENGVIAAFLNTKVNGILVEEASRALDLDISNEIIANQLRESFGNSSKERIAALLQAQGLTQEYLAESIKNQLTTQIASQIPAVVTNYVPNYIYEVEQRLDSQRRSGDLYTITKKQLAGSVKITDDEISDYYQANQSLYVVPEQRQFDIVKITADQISKTLPKITEETVRKEYESRKEDFYQPEKRSIAQALVKNPDDAQAIYESALSGTPLKTALETITSSADGFRNTADYESEGLPAELAEVAFMNGVVKGSVLPPVKTLLGHVVLKVVDIKEANYKPFESVKKNIKEEMKQGGVYDALYNKMLDIEALLDGGASFSDVLEVQKISKPSKTGYLALSNINQSSGVLKQAIDASPSLADELFSLPIGSAAYPLELDEEAFVVIGVSEIKEQSVLSFEDVKNGIKQTLHSQFVHSETENQIRLIVDNLNNGDSSADELTKSYKAKKSRFKNLKRSDDNKNVETIFDLNMDQFGYRLDNDQVTIIHVKSADFDPKKPKVEINNLRAQQKNMVDSLATRYFQNTIDIDINDSLLSHTYGQSPY